MTKKHSGQLILICIFAYQKALAINLICQIVGFNIFFIHSAKIQKTRLSLITYMVISLQKSSELLISLV